ncbi:hypothetical protein [Actinoplanes subglobosus]|uniref:Uncharacterized protein n=1 Tax=Actinoplanes subglobosus TaxID=1547892 RepID=A0ABV8ITY0_9ACTN
MTQMTFPVAFPATRRYQAPAPAAPPVWRLRGVEFAAALVVNLGADPATASHQADRGVIAAGPRVAAATTRSWITSW